MTKELTRNEFNHILRSARQLANDKDYSESARRGAQAWHDYLLEKYVVEGDRVRRVG
jgi:hypothetical protein